MRQMVSAGPYDVTSNLLAAVDDARRIGVVRQTPAPGSDIPQTATRRIRTMYGLLVFLFIVVHVPLLILKTMVIVGVVTVIDVVATLATFLLTVPFRMCLAAHQWMARRSATPRRQRRWPIG